MRGGFCRRVLVSGRLASVGALSGHWDAAGHASNRASMLRAPPSLLARACARIPACGCSADPARSRRRRDLIRCTPSNKEAVDDDLVDIIAGPSYDDNALDVFISVITGEGHPSVYTQLIPYVWNAAETHGTWSYVLTLSRPHDCTGHGSAHCCALQTLLCLPGSRQACVQGRCSSEHLPLAPWLALRA